MPTHSSTLAWKIPWMEEPGRLQSMGSQSQTRLSDFIFTFHFHALEKEMEAHSSILAWEISWTVEPGRLLSMGSQRVWHEWVKGRSNKTTSWLFSRKKKKYRKKWHDIFKKLKGKNLTTTKWLYLARLSLRIERQDKEFHRKAKAKWVYHH